MSKSDDMISRQEAKEAVDVLKRNYPSNCFEDLCKAVDIAIKALSAQPERQWVPCSEKLPEERGLYLTTTKDKAVYCDFWNEDNFDRTEIVIAWMPLPEPYKA